MNPFDLSVVAPWAAALGTGLLIGIERERSQPPESPAGLRSFVLAALAGAVAGTLGGIAVAVAVAAFALLTLAGYLQTRQSDPGLTTEFALLLTVLLGALAQHAPGLAAALGVLVAGTLAAKSMLHDFARRVLSAQELRHALLLGAAALIVLPLLPDQRITWLAGLNLHRLWLLAVLVMAIESLGHIAVRALGTGRGLALSGLAGGFVSSTATIAGMAQRAKQVPAMYGACLRGAATSNLATAIELSVLVAVLAPVLLPGLALALLPYAAGAGLAVLWIWRRTPTLASDFADDDPPDSQRPFNPWHALMFAAALTAVLLIAEAARALSGPVGAIATIGLAGFADAHSASASAAQLAAGGALPQQQALFAIGMAVSTNAASKVFAGFAGGRMRFGASNALIQAAIIALLWAGMWLALATGLARN